MFSDPFLKITISIVLGLGNVSTSTWPFVICKMLPQLMRGEEAWLGASLWPWGNCGSGGGPWPGVKASGSPQHKAGLGTSSSTRPAGSERTVKLELLSLAFKSCFSSDLQAPPPMASVVLSHQRRKSSGPGLHVTEPGECCERMTAQSQLSLR